MSFSGDLNFQASPVANNHLMRINQSMVFLYSQIIVYNV